MLCHNGTGGLFAYLYIANLRNLRQYRIIGQERFASKFFVLTRRGFEAILSYCKKSQQSQGAKFPQSAAAFLVRCCLKDPLPVKAAVGPFF